MKKKMLILPLAILPVIPISVTLRNSEPTNNLLNQPNLAHISTKRISVDDFLATDWMSDISDNRSLFSLSIPGTHDSTMYNGWGAAWFFGSLLAQTQTFSFEEQLKLGIRAFDLRSQNDGQLVHGPATSHQTLEKAFASYAKFLQQHPREFIIVRVKDENFNVQNNAYASQASKIYRDVLNKYNEYLYNPEGKGYYEISREKGFNIGQYRGKIIVLNHWHHLVNTDLKGGFSFREITSDHAIQDKYDGVDIDQKFNYITKHFRDSTNKNYIEDNAYINFTSMASGWRPDNSSARLNQRVVDYLNQHQELSTLGIVYSDFPGPSLIQAIYKTNFNYTDEILRNDGLEQTVSELTFSQIYDGDNKIILHIPNDTNAYRNLNLEINIDGEIIKKTIPADFSADKYEIILDNKILRAGQNLIVNSYKLTPKNNWYVQKKYNENSKSLEIVSNEFTQNRNALISEVNLMINNYKYNPQYNNVVEYLNINFINNLNNVHNGENSKLKDLNDKYNAVKTQLGTQINILEHIEDSISTIKDNHYNLSEVFSSVNTQKINNLKDDTLAKLNNIFQNSNSYIDPAQINSLVISLSKNEQIAKVVPIIFNDFKNINIEKYQNELNQIDHDYDFAKKYWVDEIQKVVEKPDNIIKNIESLSNRSQIISVARNLSDNFSTDLSNIKNKTQSVIHNINNIKEFFDMPENNGLRNKFIDNITENIKNLNPPHLIRLNVGLYKQKVDELKNLVNQIDTYQTQNSNFTNRNSKELTQLLNKTKNILNNEDSVEFNIDNIQTTILSLEDAKLKATESNNLYQEIINSIENSNELYPEWKMILKADLDVINDLSQTTALPIKQRITNFNEEAFISKFNNLSSLNQAQKNFLLNTIKTSVDINAIKQKISEFRPLNAQMNTLITELNSFVNFENLIGFKILTQDKKTQISTKINEVRNSINSNLSIEQINNNISALNNFHIIFSGEEIISNLNSRINNSNNLYKFQKLELTNELNNVNTNAKIEALKQKINNEINLDYVNSDINNFEFLSNIQKQNALNSLQNSTNKNDYLLNKQNYLNLNNAVESANLLLEQVSNIENNENFINNYQSNKDDLLLNINNLKQNYLQNLNSKTIVDQIILIREKLQQLEFQSLEFNKEQVKNIALNNYNEVKTRLLEQKSLVQNQSEIYNNIIDEIDKLIIDTDFENSTNDITTTSIVANTNALNLYLAQIDDKKIQSKNQYDKKQRKIAFEHFSNSFNFILSQEIKDTNLPTQIFPQQLQKSVNDQNYAILNINLLTNNSNGSLEIIYTISDINNEFSINKRQNITGLLTNQNIEDEQELQRAKKQYELKFVEANEYSNNLVSEIYSELKNNFVNDINRYSTPEQKVEIFNNYVSSLTELIEQTKIKKQEIDDVLKIKENEVKNKLNQKQKLINIAKNKIDESLDFADQNWNLTQLANKIDEFKLRLNTYKQNLDKLGLNEEQINIISQNASTYFIETKNFINNFISTYFNEIFNKITFSVLNEKSINLIGVEDIMSNVDDNEVKISIVNIARNIVESKIVLNYIANYKNLTRSGEFEISIPSQNEVNSLKSEINTNSNNDTKNNTDEIDNEITKPDNTKNSSHNNLINNVASEQSEKNSNFNKNYLFLLIIPFLIGIPAIVIPILKSKKK
ncbi:hypothetical protein EG856_00475 [Mycoplasmopsis phocirhinis]|uniref:1-phosphatidylinositol phosphodiesterase n=1 Tax=Mycoplasmopsis phocirhinis TaxID=142650 RepID=A0A4P6MRG3_9BACT|nr:hypothetical protein [Mycoplasmopsis phocirhinis]QBF34411.1 hypothetical protein EG856_00475 [Mycoplasmopsis phocirhinis]